MMIFEKKRIVHHAKFGVLYKKGGQQEENEIFSNEHGSPQFVAFLTSVAGVIPLKGHTGFRGGLDIREDLTGKTAAYTRISYGVDGAVLPQVQPDGEITMELIVHVAPLLPFDPLNPQQLHRKRHIGNDVVVVVFCEGEDPFNPDVLTSNYNHVFLLVRPVPSDPSGRKKPTHYSVVHASARGVKPFRPYVPADTLVPAPLLRQWLLTKILNAERAAMYAPEFSQKLSRTITTVLNSWLEEY
jgi:RAP1 GTPase activating protein 1